MSQSWSHGYFTEIEYTRGIYREMTPANIRFALLAKRVIAPEEQKFTYAELGCGHGQTALTIAACYPNAEVIAVDINPGQIAGARAIAEAAGLGNIRFEEWSFADLLEADTPPLDYVAAHGILTWVGEEQHKEIFDVMRRKLKPGGISYVSYNTLPGWAPVLPIRRVMQEHAKRSSRPAVERVKDATNFVLRLQKANAAVFRAMPVLKDRLEKMETLAPNYLAHEYLNEHWIPFAFPEIVEMASEAKMSFVASAALGDHIDVTTMIESPREVMKEIEDPVFYETVRDLFVNQGFRRDLFAKGPRQITLAEQLTAFGEQRFVALGDASARPTHFSTAMGQMELKAEIYDPLAEALATGPISVNELRQRNGLRNVPVNSIAQGLIILVGEGYVSPCLSESAEEAARKTTDSLNQVFLERARWVPENNFLISPVTGAGMVVDSLQQLFLRHGDDIDAQVAGAVDDLTRSNRAVSDGKTQLIDPTARDAYLRSKATDFRNNRLPVLKRAGIV